MLKDEEDILAYLHRNLEISGMTLLNFTNLSKEEKEMILRWRNSEEVRRWMFTDHIISLKEHLDFIDSLKNDNRNFYFLVKRVSEYLGVVYLIRVDLRNRNAYLGIYANPEKKIAGLGSILGEVLLKLTFDVAKLHTLKLEVFEDNERAIALYRKLGFVEEGRLREFIFRDGKWKDVIVMGITEDEYRKIRCSER
jgi:UDP-4-amino-4,6-dideoxy-N-acetyl-beta-L-altrosamine N-acetyltransferase